MKKEEVIEILERFVIGAKPCSQREIVYACASAYRMLKEQPSLPSDLDEAAEEELDDVDANWQIDERDDGCTEPGYNQKQMLLMFRSGAECMAGQGVSMLGRVGIYGVDVESITKELREAGFNLGEEIILQIRKKQ